MFAHYSILLPLSLFDPQAFMQELESDRDMRSKLNLYKITDTRATKKPSGAAEGGMEVEGAGTCVFALSIILPIVKYTLSVSKRSLHFSFILLKS